MPFSNPTSLHSCNKQELLEKVKFRTKFEVALAEWNPRFDLLALGSRDGEVVVKRFQWKTGWKKNFGRQQPLVQFSSLIAGSSDFSPSAPPEKQKDELVSLCWSPDGQILLAAFGSGRCFYLETQTGNTLFIRILGFSPLTIKWLDYRPKLQKARVLMGGGEKLSADDFSFGADASKEHAAVCADVETFYAKFFRKSLAGTFICVFYSTFSSLVLEVLADGVLPVHKFFINDSISTHLKIPIDASAIFIDSVEFRNKTFRVPFKMNNRSGGEEEGEEAILEFSGSTITPTRMCIYSQISECLCCISFCCIYLQEMLKYCAGNCCRILTKGISSGLLPATHSLRQTVCALRAHLFELFSNLEEENNEQIDVVESLLNTLLQISSSSSTHPIVFSPIQNFEEHACKQFLDDFENSILALKQKLHRVLDATTRELDQTQNAANNNNPVECTIGQQMEICFRHFRTFFEGGITKFFDQTTLEKCTILRGGNGAASKNAKNEECSNNSNDSEEEEEGENEEEEVEEEEENRCM